MKLNYLIVALLASTLSFGQEVSTYENEKGDTHLCGTFPLNYLTTDTTYQKWFNENYNTFELADKQNPWKQNLENTQVDIYLGTWCGDSQKWVPRFVKLWDELGLEREQLNFIALYDTDEKYKQGPAGEEKGLGIHRVPTFIFKENDQEVARIVESPRNDLTTDLAQIALGYASEPNYMAATYLIDLFETQTLEEIRNNINTHFYNVYKLLSKSNELNTLGYVFLRSGRIDEALMVFELNTHYFRYDPNVYDSYAEAYAVSGNSEKAIANYEKVLSIDPNNTHAREQLVALKGE